jgi:molybdenum cofactor cytidylyltransferase
MIFAPFRLDDALGTVLAHSHRLPDRVLKKGTVLDVGAVDALRAAGRREIIAARLAVDDVGENEAADRMARAFAAPLLSRRRATTGRVNLHADAAGVLRVDAAAIDRINGTDEAFTVATLPDYAPVAAGEMVATIKIIPFAVPGAALGRIEGIAGEAAAIRLHPFRRRTVGLVLSELPGLKASVVAGTIEATEGRVAGLGARLLPPRRCAHGEDAIAAELAALLAEGADLLLVAGASATVDRRDIGPAAVVRAGGTIDHFGMPVDPGNLICLGHIGAVPALVLPGCARSPKPNGIDWVLQRLCAGLPLGPAEIMRMGVGGLLKDTAARPLPRARAVAAETPTTPRPGIAAVILAAGKSTRMAPWNKLLVADRAGKPMIARVVDNVLSTAARPIVVVTGHNPEDIQAALAGRPVTFVHAPDYADGLSASLRRGIGALPASATGALVVLGDMPLVTGRILDRLIDAHDADEGRGIVVPTHKGQAGNPVLWDRRYFGEILALSGDSGARSLIRRHLEQVAEVEVNDDAVLRDFDTRESLASLPPRLRPADVA